MSYNLAGTAHRYVALGYSVGFAKAKTLVSEFRGDVPHGKFDGISIILDDLVCVDFDTHLSMDLGWGCDLPPTWKEKTPRGFHLFYLLENNSPNPCDIFGEIKLQGSPKRESKIKWKPNVDLLVKGRKPVRYGGAIAQAHALCYPTPGYSLIHPDIPPPKDELTPAPSWLLDAVKV